MGEGLRRVGCAQEMLETLFSFCLLELTQVEEASQLVNEVKNQVKKKIRKARDKSNNTSSFLSCSIFCFWLKLFTIKRRGEKLLLPSPSLSS